CGSVPRRRLVPRAKYTKSPGPLPTIQQVQRSKFRFRDDQRRKLAKLLPRRLALLSTPSEYMQEAAKASYPPNWRLKTIADAVIYETERAISSHLTTELLPFDKMPTVGKVRSAIRRLRKALEPFTRGWVDTQTADLIPQDLDTKLEVRE